jgi:hypothetical protein
VQEELDMGRIQTAAAGLAIAASAAMYGLIGVAPTARADPPICGSPDRPCAGPSPLTPEQQCALTAYRMMMPCNWLGQQVPQGTPGSWG